MTDAEMENGESELHPNTMDGSAVGRTAVWRGGLVPICRVHMDGWADIYTDGLHYRVPQCHLKLTVEKVCSTMHEIQDLVNELVSTGQDRPRLLSRQVAKLLEESRGALTRAERLQAAAMLACAAGLFVADGDPQEG